MTTTHKRIRIEVDEDLIPFIEDQAKKWGFEPGVYARSLFRRQVAEVLRRMENGEEDAH